MRSALHREIWTRMADEEGLADDAERLLPHAQPCFVVGSQTPGMGPIGASRLGGVPDLPSALAWPTQGDRHLTFVAQIDLGALTPEWVDGLPSSGWLYFFVGRDAPAWDVTHRVLYFDGPRDALSATTVPSGTRAIDDGSPRDFVAHQLTFRPSFVFDRAIETALGLEEFALEFLTASHTQIAGLPVAWDTDPRQDAYLSKSGLASLRHRMHLAPEDLAKAARDAWAAGDDERAEEIDLATELLRAYRADEAMHLDRMARWRVLFLLGSAREVGMCWWDAGLLQFLVHDDDMRQRRFDGTYCCVSSS
ncbi:MAG: DUF1963 domain-containing protein [Deltaproteobacteria bacterium]|nr:DUF1963 domain-containing protein [Deltaproteobacteria bacterium]